MELTLHNALTHQQMPSKCLALCVDGGSEMMAKAGLWQTGAFT